MLRMLITGTTRGIGKCIYERFFDSYDVTTINRHKLPGSNIECDLSDIEAVSRMCSTISEYPFDVVINNAGGASPMMPEKITADALVKCTNLNYHAPVLIMHSVLEGMAGRGYGRIINISSIASKGPRGLLARYGAAKAALERYTTSLASFYGGSGVTLNCICPGGVRTKTSMENRRELARMSGMGEEYYNDQFAQRNGLGRMVREDEVVGLVAYLLTDSGGAVSGQTWNVCGTMEVH